MNIQKCTRLALTSAPVIAICLCCLTVGYNSVKGQYLSPQLKDAKSTNKSWYDYRGGYRSLSQFGRGKTKGIIKWRFATKNKVRSSPAIGRDGLIYIGSGRKVYAIDGAKGKLRWSYTTGDIVESSPIVDRNGNLFIGSNDHYLYALNGHNGMKLWQFHADAEIESSPSLCAGNIVLVGTLKGTVYAINSKNGVELWKSQTGGPLSASPIAGPQDNILVGSDDGTLYVLDIKTGLEIKRIDLDKQEAGFSIGIYATPTAAQAGLVYVCTELRHVYAIDTSNWQSNLVFTTDDPILSTPAIDSNGTLYFGTGGPFDHRVYAIDPATGLKKWSYQIGGETDDLIASPVLDDNGILYIGSLDHMLYAIDSRTGKKKWTVRTKGQIWSSAAIAPNGNIYVGSDDGYVYCIR